MINKDYILRLAERFGRELSIILGLRKRDKDEEALIYVDELMLKMTGLTSRFVNSLSEEMLVKAISPLGPLNIESCLWIATLLKVEGEIYETQKHHTESYYRYLKSLYLFLEVLEHEYVPEETGFYQDIRELLHKLADYELPSTLKNKLITYYEYIGQYARAEDILFELLETPPLDLQLIARGRAFYKNLLTKRDEDLQAGNLSREEVHEGLEMLQTLPDRLAH